MADRIVITRLPDGFDVNVRPAIIPDNLGWAFADHAEAMKWAIVLHQRTGFPIVDQGRAAA